MQHLHLYTLKPCSPLSATTILQIVLSHKFFSCNFAYNIGSRLSMITATGLANLSTLVCGTDHSLGDEGADTQINNA
jgi:hypothetical protein